MSRSWESSRLLVEDQIAQLREDYEQHDKALSGLGERLAKALLILEEAGHTRPLVGKLAMLEMGIDANKEKIEALTAELRASILSHQADYTILKSILSQIVERDSAAKLESEKRKSLIDVENVKGKWAVILAIVVAVSGWLVAILKP